MAFKLDVELMTLMCLKQTQLEKSHLNDVSDAPNLVFQAKNTSCLVKGCPALPDHLRSKGRQTSGARAQRDLRAGCETSETNLSKRSRAANTCRGLEAPRARIMRKRASVHANRARDQSRGEGEQVRPISAERCHLGKVRGT
jgi:hypothetical protein